MRARWRPAVAVVSLSAVVPVVAMAQQPAPPPRVDHPTPHPSASFNSPPPPDLPPPPPPPWNPTAPALPPIEAPEAASSDAPLLRPPPPAADHAEVEALKHRLAVLERRMAAERHELREAERDRIPRDEREQLDWLRHFKVTGYVQPQLVWNGYNAAASPNNVNGQIPASASPNDSVATSNGTTTNTDFFRLRNARLRIDFAPTEGSRLTFEIDPTPPAGETGVPLVIVRTVEAVGIARFGGSLDATTEFAAGVFKVPFGFEVLQADPDRPFIERSWTERNLFPGEFDTGARAYTTMLDKRLDVQVAVVNGQVEGEKTFAVLPDLNRGKDLAARVAYHLPWLTVGASGYYGQGQLVNPALLEFKNYSRWGVDLELAAHHRFTRALGETRLFAEGVRAQNLDRGVNYAFALPTLPADVVHGSVVSHDELGFFVRVEQDFNRWFTLALRYDTYTPDSAQGSNSRDTFGAVGVVHFTRALQWMLEYDHALDQAHVPGAPVPTKVVDTLSNVLQARF
jgi:hypothetical protein